jgi:hypothetical protein
MERSGENLIRITFTYPDGRLANKVTQDLVSRVIAENISRTSARANATFQFFNDEVDQLGKSWLQASASVKSTAPSDPRYELLTLDRDQKRKEYESVVQKLGTLGILKDLANQGQDMRLELLDAASLPQDPDTAASIVWLAGLGCGVAVGLLAELRRSLRTASSDLTVPEPAELA